MSPSVSSASSHASVSEKEPKETVHTYGADISDEVRSRAPLLRGRQLTAALAFVAGTGFTLFGYVHLRVAGIRHSCLFSYDQGVMSALLTANQVCRSQTWLPNTTLLTSCIV